MPIRCRPTVALACWLGLVATGCTGIRLDDSIPVTALNASLPRGSRLLPGASSPLVVVSTAADGRQLVTKGQGHGKVRWDSFDIESSVAQVTSKGVVRMPIDPRETDGKMPHVRIAVKDHPDVSTELDVPVRYDGAFVADFSGASGLPGIAGMDGSRGSSGASGSMADPAHPQDGSDGGDGAPGSDGGDGSPGRDGQDVHVWMALRDGEPPLLQVRVATRESEKMFLVDPHGGSLLVSCDGGVGGAGGAAGRGGRGGQGGSGSYEGSSGRNGLDGLDGNKGGDGASGRGGTITVSVDPKARPFLEVLRFSNRDGGGPVGWPPVVRAEPVALLW